MKKYIYTLLTICVGFSASAQYDPDALEVLNAMSSKYKEMGPYGADFTQELVNESAGINDKITGSIVVSEDKYVLKVAGQEIYNNGTDVYSYSEEISEVTISTYEPEEQEISVSNIYDLYKDGFKYILMATNQKGDRMVELDPESKDKSYFKIKLVIDKNDALKKFTVMERSGNQYIYSINSLEKKPDLTSDYFTFDESKYPDVEVIDFR
ncbi:MAG: outer membrane lipoprotein carrier protein LolA [Cyclobacteriaceae bacterium]